MTRRSHGRPALPPDAKDEILHVLFANMEISGDEIAAILKKHHVSCDADVLHQSDQTAEIGLITVHTENTFGYIN